MSTTEFDQNITSDAPIVPEDFAFEDEHPQLKIPFTAIVEERKLEGTSLSLTKAEVSGLLSPSMANSEELVTLRFDFDGYSVNLFAEATIKISGESDDPKISLVFTHPTGEHLPPLRYILNSFIAGDVTSVGGLLGFNGPTQVKATKPITTVSSAKRASNVLRAAALFGLGVGLVASASAIVIDRVSYKYEPAPITLSLEGDLMRATASGQITYVNFEAQESEVAYSISSNTGDLLSTKMPCDCEVQAFNGFFEGATVLAGDPIMKLVSSDSKLTSTTELSSEGATRFIEGDRPEIVLADGSKHLVDITFIEDASGSNSSQNTSAKINIPDGSTINAGAGDIARLRFQKDWVWKAKSQAAQILNFVTASAS